MIYIHPIKSCIKEEDFKLSPEEDISKFRGYVFPQSSSLKYTDNIAMGIPLIVRKLPQEAVMSYNVWAFAIARRGMRLKERVKINLATPGLSVRNDLGDCSWAKVQKLIQQEIIRPNTRKVRIKRSEKLATLNPCRSFLSKLE